MRHRGKRRLAVLLAAAMLSANFMSTAMAGQEKGWVHNLETDEWSYYEDKDHEDMRKNDFAPSGTAVKGAWTMYWLEEDGHLLKEGGTIEAPDGNSYEINVGGAVKGGQLYGGDENWGRWYTEPSTGKLTYNMWQLIDDGDGEHWYYFAKADGDGNDQSERIGYALQNQIKGIGRRNGRWKLYHFDQEGRMSVSTDIRWDGGKEFDAADPLYVMHAQKDGVLAGNKWLYLDGDWHYFQRREVPDYYDDYDNTFGIMVTDDVLKLDGKSYEFDSDGNLISDNAPYGAVDSIKITADKEEVIIGGEVTVTADVSVEVASPSDASRPTATMSNAQKNALVNDKAYDASVRLTRDGKLVGDYALELEDGKLRYTITDQLKREGDITVVLMIDDVESNKLEITCKNEPDEDKKDDPEYMKDYMKDVFEGILDSGQLGEEIVEQFKTEYKGIDSEVAEKLWEDDSFLDKVREFETLYRSSQGIGRYQEDLDGVTSLLDRSKVSVVGAFLNADVSDTQPVVLSMNKAPVTADISGLEGAKKIPVDISLSGGGIHASSLDIPVTITMPVPKGLSKTGLRLYHIHDGQTTELRLNQAQLSDGNVRFTTDGFSTFVFAGRPVSDGGGSGSDVTSGRQVKAIPETTGAWKQTGAGWQFLNPEGFPYLNEWIYASGKWYWVDPAGMMVQGWRQVKDQWYYFTPGSGEMVNGWVDDQNIWYYTDETGARVSGWKEIGQKWYYFGDNGAMLTDSDTPDGYHVGADGVWMR